LEDNGSFVEGKEVETKSASDTLELVMVRGLSGQPDVGESENEEKHLPKLPSCKRCSSRNEKEEVLVSTVC
jgi:hypothetical protein